MSNASFASPRLLGFVCFGSAGTARVRIRDPRGWGNARVALPTLIRRSVTRRLIRELLCAAGLAGVRNGQRRRGRRCQKKPPPANREHGGGCGFLSSPASFSPFIRCFLGRRGSQKPEELPVLGVS